MKLQLSARLLAIHLVHSYRTVTTNGDNLSQSTTEWGPGNFRRQSDILSEKPHQQILRFFGTRRILGSDANWLTSSSVKRYVWTP